ncbi:MAG: hypothetical protein KC645_10130 [Gemmatimonadetes bacterium]|nr:hypothetical protein [Gemmatimonadota bacterium]
MRAARRALLALLVLVPAPLSAQTLKARGGDLTIGGRLHTELITSSVPEGDEADFFLRRARIEVDARLGDRIDARIMPEYSGTTHLEDAWVRYTLSPRLRVLVGQFKRSFDLFELESSTELPIVERDGRIPGLDLCPGVGRLCTWSRLTEQLQFAARDVGVHVDGRIGERVSWEAAMTNGEGLNARDINGAKSWSGRVAVNAGRGWTVGVSGAAHDFRVDDDDRYADALSIDARFGRYRGGPLLLAAVSWGDNWKLADPAGGAGPRFGTAQVMAAYHIALGDEHALLSGIEPTARISVADADRGNPEDGGALWTPGLMLYLRNSGCGGSTCGRNRVAVNMDVYHPGGGDTEVSFKLMSFVYF